MIETRYWDNLIVTYDEVFDLQDLKMMCDEIYSQSFFYGMVDNQVEIPTLAGFLPFGDQKSNTKIEYKPTGLSTCNNNVVTDLSQQFFYKQCWSFFESHLPELDGLRCCRSHINLFAPNEHACYHTDNFTDPNYTVIFYANLDYNHDQMGETKFILRPDMIPNTNDITFQSDHYPISLNIMPIPGRIVMFRGDIEHSAIGMRDKHRFTPTWQFIVSNDESLPICKYKN